MSSWSLKPNFKKYCQKTTSSKKAIHFEQLESKQETKQQHLQVN